MTHQKTYVVNELKSTNDMVLGSRKAYICSYSYHGQALISLEGFQMSKFELENFSFYHGPALISSGGF